MRMRRCVEEGRLNRHPDGEPIEMSHLHQDAQADEVPGPERQIGAAAGGRRIPQVLGSRTGSSRRVGGSSSLTVGIAGSRTGLRPGWAHTALPEEQGGATYEVGGEGGKVRAIKAAKHKEETGG